MAPMVRPRALRCIQSATFSVVSSNEVDEARRVVEAIGRWEVRDAVRCVTRRRWRPMPPAGLEPAANGLGNRCSIHLSYGGRAIRAGVRRHGAAEERAAEPSREV